MAGSLNKVMLIGHLGKDPEMRSTNGGKKIANFRIATSESWRDKQTGERQEKTEWHTICVFNENLAKIAEQYLKKGSKVYIEGKLQTRKWQDQNGADRWSTEVVLNNFSSTLTLLDRRGDNEDVGAAYEEPRSAPASAPRERGYAGGGSLAEDLDDEIPFGPEWR